jgi:hypothetical protein
MEATQSNGLARRLGMIWRVVRPTHRCSLGHTNRWVVILQYCQKKRDLTVTRKLRNSDKRCIQTYIWRSGILSSPILWEFVGFVYQFHHLLSMMVWAKVCLLFRSTLNFGGAVNWRRGRMWIWQGCLLFSYSSAADSRADLKSNLTCEFQTWILSYSSATGQMAGLVQLVWPVKTASLSKTAWSKPPPWVKWPAWSNWCNRSKLPLWVKSPGHNGLSE